MKQNKVYVYGRHAVDEAVRHAPKAVLKVYIDPRAGDTKFKRFVEEAGVATAPLSEGLARADMKSGTSHQGVVAQISTFNLLTPYDKFAQDLKPTPETSLVFLASVEDPHNVGAIIRTSAGFGMSGVLLPERGTAPVTAAVIRASAGMTFRLPLVGVGDIYKTISDLKKRGFKVYALAGEGKNAIGNEAFAEPAVFILGNEGEGIPKALLDVCDKIISIPTDPKCESLNVAAAAAVTLFAWSTKHPQAIAKTS